MTTLRWVRLLGPDGNGGPLWQLTANVLFEPADGRYVDRAPALRGLNLSGTTVIVRDPKEKKDYRFVSPELLQARIEVTGKDNTKIAAPRLSDFQEGDDRPVAIGDHDVLLSPVGAKWPDIEYENQKAQITVPAFRLSGGAIYTAGTRPSVWRRSQRRIISTATTARPEASPTQMPTPP